MGLVSGVTFIYAIHVDHSTLVDHEWRPDPQGGPRARRRRFLALMVGALGFTAPAPPRDPPSTFVTLMVDTLGSPSAAPRGPAIDIFYIDGGCSQIPTSNTRVIVDVFTLMVDALGSQSAPTRGLAIDVS
jgi:hypothetical protein